MLRLGATGSALALGGVGFALPPPGGRGRPALGVKGVPRAVAAAGSARAAARPLADTRVTDSVLGILGRTQALSARPELVSDGEFYGRRFAHGVACPALRAGSVRFTGSA